MHTSPPCVMSSHYILPRLLTLLLVLFAFGCQSADEPSEAEPLTYVEPVTESASSPLQVFGYHAWWMRDTWREYDFALLDKIYFFEIPVAADGSVTETYGWPQEWHELVAYAHERDTDVVPTFAVLEAEIFKSLFASPAALARLETGIMDLVRAAEADGVHLNFEIFEAVGPELRGNMAAFVQSLRNKLRAWRPSAQLTIFLPGFDYGEAYDEYTLSQLADYLVVQGYDMHWLTAPNAGPVAPLTGWNGANWRAIIDRYASLGIGPERLIMTLPYYGYEWPTVSGAPGAATRGEGVPITYAPVNPDYLPLIQINAEARIKSYGLQRDPTSNAPFYTYEGADGWYQGWFEDAESLAAKLAFIEAEGLAGTAIFLLGYDDGRFDPVLRTAR